MKNILVVQGGGRANGNTTQLVDAFMQGAKAAGHAVEKISLNQTEVKGCLGCNACRHGKSCVQKDGFKEIKAIAKPGDVVLLSPASASWDQYKECEIRGKEFKDYVKELN